MEKQARRKIKNDLWSYYSKIKDGGGGILEIMEDVFSK